jgi:hypothetical protein
MLQVLWSGSEAFSESKPLFYYSSNQGQFDCPVMISNWGKFPNEGNRNKVLVGISLLRTDLELGSLYDWMFSTSRFAPKKNMDLSKTRKVLQSQPPGFFSQMRTHKVQVTSEHPPKTGAPRSLPHQLPSMSLTLRMPSC